MPKAFVLDLETAGRPDAGDFLPPLEAPSNYRDAEKIAAYLAEKRASQLERAALSAETARILCAGILRHGLDPLFIGDDDERLLIRKVWLELETKESDETFVTFNGMKFDFPMMVRRSFALHLPIPTWCPLDARWPARSHTDLFAVWCCGDRGESISLDRLSRLCGLSGKTGSGADFARLWSCDREAALAYLRLDLELTRDLFLRMTGTGPIE